MSIGWRSWTSGSATNRTGERTLAHLRPHGFRVHPRSHRPRRLRRRLRGEKDRRRTICAAWPFEPVPAHDPDRSGRSSLRVPLPSSAPAKGTAVYVSSFLQFADSRVKRAAGTCHPTRSDRFPGKDPPATSPMNPPPNGCCPSGASRHGQTVVGTRREAHHRPFPARRSRRLRLRLEPRDWRRERGACLNFAPRPASRPLRKFLTFFVSYRSPRIPAPAPPHAPAQPPPPSTSASPPFPRRPPPSLNPSPPPVYDRCDSIMFALDNLRREHGLDTRGHVFHARGWPHEARIRFSNSG